MFIYKSILKPENQERLIRDCKAATVLFITARKLEDAETKGRMKAALILFSANCRAISGLS